MDKRLLAGLDVGTTGCKVSVFSAGGECLGSAYRAYPAQRSLNVHEIDADVLWTAVQQVLCEAAQRFHGIAAIGVASFGETFVVLDQQDRVLLPAMLNTDPRGRTQCERLVERLGREPLIRLTGVNPHHMYSLPKLMWIQDHQPQLYARIRRVLLMEDYVVYRLTGRAQIDHSLATRTMAFDIHQLRWSDEVFRAAGIDARLFSQPVPTGTAAGAIRAGLIPGLDGTLIVSISHDQVAAAIGSGVLDESRAVDGAGTVQCCTPVFRRYDAMKMAQNQFCVVPFLDGGRYVTYAFSYTGGALVKWFCDNLAGAARREAAQRQTDVHSVLEGGWGGTPTGILVLPHFAGAATPYMDDGSQGAIVGLTLSHTQQDLYRAILEGVCLEMRLNQERLMESGVQLAPLYATGGGARSRRWLQLKADVLNVPVTALAVSEAGATGSAMLAGIAAGVFGSLDEAVRAMVREKETFLPREDIHQQYEDIYQRYRRLYDAVRPLCKERD